MRAAERTILIRRSVVESILSYAQMFHPRESILLLRGKVDRERILVEDVEVPPLAAHGEGFSNFPLYMLPIDFSVVGTAHSHPSGALRPSVGDLNNLYGRIMVITAYPYQSEHSVAVFDGEGNRLRYEVV